MKTKKHLKKLDHEMIDLYKIKVLVRSSYQLELLTTMKIHNDQKKFEINNILDAKRAQCHDPDICNFGSWQTGVIFASWRVGAVVSVWRCML